MTSFYMGRRTFLKTGVSAVAATALPRVAFAAPRSVKIGLVAPVTGPLAIFTEQLPWTIDQIKAFTNGQIDVGGTKHPLEIIVRDSQSNPNRAAEVAKGLILQDKVDLVTTFATPETVNPVADQCEVSGVPCLSNDCPLEPYFFGRQGDPKKGFDWTYNYFFSAVNMADAYYDAWDQVPTNKVVGALWPNDNDGNAFSKIFTGMAAKRGYKIVDPGRFDLPSGNYSAQIAAFKSAGAEIIAGVLPPPEFTAFMSAAAQQSLQPKVISMAKATEFPAAIAPARGARRRPVGRGVVVGDPPVQVRPNRTDVAGTRGRLPEGERQAGVDDARLPARAVRDGARCVQAHAETRRSSFHPRRHIQDGLRLDRRAGQLRQGPLSEHLRDAARHRPVEEGNEVPVRPRQRRQHYRAEHPGRWEDAADRPWLIEATRSPPGDRSRRRSRCCNSAASRGALAASGSSKS